MGERYAVVGTESTTTTGYTTAVLIIGATTVRPRIYDVEWGYGATPADTTTFVNLQRATATGTAGSSPTPQPLDSASPASLGTAGIGDYSVEPTYTAAANLFELPMNQRAAYRWVVAPGGEIVVPATASNGVGSRVKGAAYTGSMVSTVHFEE